MQRMRITGVCLVAMFAMSAVFASGASATKLHLKTVGKGDLKAGDEIKAFSSDLIFHTVAGDLECTKNTLTGTALTGPGAKVKGTITEEQSEGEIGFGTACKTSALGPAMIVSSGFNWPIEFKKSGTIQIKGTKAVTFKSTFIGVEKTPSCEFEAKKLASSFNTSGAVTITTTGQTFKKSKSKENSGLCPASGTLTGTFNMTSGGEAVEAEVK
jgi:hypothetical protein